MKTKINEKEKFVSRSEKLNDLFKLLSEIIERYNTIKRDYFNMGIRNSEELSTVSLFLSDMLKDVSNEIIGSKTSEVVKETTRIKLKNLLKQN